MNRTAQSTARSLPATVALLLLPVLLLAGVIAVFLSTGGGLDLAPAAPVEALQFERYVLRPGTIELHVQNTGPDMLTLAQVGINSAIVQFTAEPAIELERLQRATIHLSYPWVYGEAYNITVFTSNSITFNLEIPVAFDTPEPNPRTFLGFTLVGLYVGVIPVFLGILWYPALRRLGKRAMTFLMAATIGLLIFLGVDTLSEALELSAGLASPFQGVGLIAIGAVGTYMLLDAVSAGQNRAGRGDSAQRLAVATMIAVGIGLHNLGEGLAIGAAYSVGEIALGTFLVVGFIIQNITEGLGIIAPVLRDRPSIRSLAIMGVIGGAPAIIGAWIGGYTPSAFLAVLFLAVGTGAIFEVVAEIARLVRKDTSQDPMPFTVFAGVVVGMLLLWITGLLIK